MDAWSILASRYPRLAGQQKGMIRCPCHDDRLSSLSVKRTATGDVLLHCFAGCAWQDVRTALELPRMASNSDRPILPPAAPPKRRVVAEYPYRDLAGDVVAIKQRWTLPGGEKTFTWLALHPDGQMRMTFPDGMSQHDLPLYRLPECVALTREGASLILVEGEKDADTLAALGFAATTHASGASGAGSAYAVANYRPFFAPDRVPVCIVPDHDAPGAKHAARLARVLGEAGYTVRVWAWGEGEVPAKGDISDYVAQLRENGANDTLIALQIARRAQHAPVWTPDEDPRAPLPDAEAEMERAAILEYDAGYPRAVAERIARHDVRQAATVRLAALPVTARMALGTDDPELAAIFRDAARFAPG